MTLRLWQVVLEPSLTSKERDGAISVESYRNYLLVSTSNTRQLGGQIAFVLLPPGAHLRTKVHT